LSGEEEEEEIIGQDEDVDSSAGLLTVTVRSSNLRRYRGTLQICQNFNIRLYVALM